VSFCLSLFPWASFHRPKAGLKLQTLLDHGRAIRAFVAVSPAQEHEVRKSRNLNLPKGSIVVEDLGSPDCSWYGPLTAQVLISGQTIRFTGMKALDCPFSLRRSVYRDQATQNCMGS